MFQEFKQIKFKPETEKLITVINVIIREYQKQGFKLTVRQLYYQLVARDFIPNNLRSYNKVKATVNDGRLAGYIDWDAIEDRTREFIKRQRWETGGEILEAVAHSFHMDMWTGQDYRLFVVVEKEALAGVLEPVCRRFDMPLLAARGYPSVSVLYDFATKDLQQAFNERQQPVILHLGDHDPSGIDMTRDLGERLFMLCDNTDIDVRRIALNMVQIQDQKPPPNPAKDTDARFEGYERKYGPHSWELDALSPTYLARLVERHTLDYLDPKKSTRRSA
jgi:hypothetical protein